MDSNVPKDQMNSLLDQGVFSSAQLLGSFLVSSSSANLEANPQLKAESLVLLGDSFFKEREYRRAIHTYKQGLQCHRMVPKHNTGTVRAVLSASNRSSSPSSLSTSTINENEVKFRIASSHFALNENKLALAEGSPRLLRSTGGRPAPRVAPRVTFRTLHFSTLSTPGLMEGIPNKARTLQMNLMLGKLYRNSRHSRSAIPCFKECLRQCPYTIEAITSLAELGVKAKDIISLLPQTPIRSGRVPFDHLDLRWLQYYAEAQCCIASNDYKGGLELYSELLQRFPNNVHILLEMAKVEAIIGKKDEAKINFEKVRSIDPYSITYMDEYALLLKSGSDSTKLNKLIADLVHMDTSRPEVLVALSVFWERKDNKAALVYADKSVRLDERHVLGYIMKGNLLLSLNRPEPAVVAFRGAQELRPDLRSYQGLVRSYLTLSKLKEAMHAAREAMKAMPQSAKALKLVGDVHACSTTGRENAKKYYESALRHEPGYLAAALALAELHVLEGRNGDAVSLLERYLLDWADDSLHVKLAQVFAATNMLQDALLHYQAALRINHENEAAKKGLERLEKQMKGVDPDAPEEDDENEVEDVDVEQDDTGLL